MPFCLAGSGSRQRRSEVRRAALGTQDRAEATSTPRTVSDPARRGTQRAVATDAPCPSPQRPTGGAEASGPAVTDDGSLSPGVVRAPENGSQAARPPRVVVVGSLVRDITVRTARLPERGATGSARDLLVDAGGKGGNPALTVARLGASVRMVGAVGGDEAGRTVLRELWEAGVETESIRVDGRTGEVVHLVEDGAATRALELPGCDATYIPDATVLRDACAGADVVLVSTALPEAAVRAAVSHGRAVSALVVVDGAGPPDTTRAVLGDADVVRLDASEASALLGTEVSDVDGAERAASALLGDPFPRVAVVQAGDEGDVVVSATGALRLPRLPLEAVDPAGAGDAFVSVLALLLGCETPLAASARVGSAAAAHTAARLGARTAFGGVEELLALMAETGDAHSTADGGAAAVR